MCCFVVLGPLSEVLSCSSRAFTEAMCCPCSSRVFTETMCCLVLWWAFTEAMCCLVVLVPLSDVLSVLLGPLIGVLSC